MQDAALNCGTFQKTHKSTFKNPNFSYFIESYILLENNNCVILSSVLKYNQSYLDCLHEYLLIKLP